MKDRFFLLLLMICIAALAACGKGGGDTSGSGDEPAGTVLSTAAEEDGAGRNTKRYQYGETVNVTLPITVEELPDGGIRCAGQDGETTVILPISDEEPAEIVKSSDND